MSISTDALIIGAGPCGLFQVFELGLLDIKAHVVDTLPQVGGQCSELYPDKPIYDIPAWPVIGAEELVQKLMEQIKPFDPDFHLGEEVKELQRQDDGRFLVKTSKGTEFLARTVIIAGGLGSFQPRRLRIRGTEAFEGSQIHYRVRDPSQFDGKRVLVLGGGDSALDWALELVDRTESMALMHRRLDYRAQPASVNKMKQLQEAGRITALQGNVSGLIESDGRLTGVDLQTTEGDTIHVDCDQILVFWGLQPKLGPIAEWGLGMEKNQIEVSTEDFSTNEPGIYAVGDINTYPGKKKLILSGFHEAALAAFGIRKYLHPDERVMVQYTTTSPKMHERLGVK